MAAAYPTWPIIPMARPKSVRDIDRSHLSYLEAKERAGELDTRETEQLYGMRMRMGLATGPSSLEDMDQA